MIPVSDCLPFAWGCYVCVCLGFISIAVIGVDVGVTWRIMERQNVNGATMLDFAQNELVGTMTGA